MAVPKEELLAAFERFLEKAPAGKEEGEIGLAQLFTELSVLRTEVRDEVRSFHRTLEEYRRLLDLAEREQAGHAARLREMERRLLRPVLLDLVDLRERQVAGVEAVTGLRPPWLVRLLSRRLRRRFHAVLEGLELTRERFDQSLAALGVEAVKAAGRRFDPCTMRAAEVVQVPSLPAGEVVEELRTGWLWNGEVLRLAEVKVNQAGK